MKRFKTAIQSVCPWATRENLLAAWAKLFIKNAETLPRPDETAPIYIAGLFQSHAGVASGAKVQLRNFQASGKQVYAIDLTGALKQSGTVEFSGTSLDYKSLPCGNASGTVIIHQNPRWFLIALRKLGREFLKNKYIVGYWAWELEDIPEWWIDSIDYVHEIWVPSNFVRAAIAPHTDKPVKVVAHPARFEPRPARNFAEDGTVRILYIFDTGSSYVRKNPIAAIQAFKLAFGDRKDVELVIKISRQEMYIPGWRELQKAAAKASNVRLINAFMSQNELDDLYRQSDIYLSLHRSEGFGLTIFEAMNFGLHIVATGWSGNMDFFHGPRCYPVNYTLIPVIDPQNIYPYPDCRWAEPDITHAAELLRQLVK